MQRQDGLERRTLALTACRTSSATHRRQEGNRSQHSQHSSSQSQRQRSPKMKLPSQILWMLKK
jgi:hypothetical protein